MIEILNDNLTEYLDANSSSIHPYLLKIERETHLNMLHSHMVSGKYQANFLQMIASISNAKNVLEIGTFTGFASLAFAEVIPDNGKVHTIEADKELYEISKTNIDNSPWKNKVTSHFGEALSIIPTLISEVDFDLIFIDADKKNNLKYYNLIVDKLKSNAIVLVDNVLWKGKVLDDKKDNITQIIQDFNESIKSDDRVEAMILPIRDGISLIRKK